MRQPRCLFESETGVPDLARCESNSPLWRLMEDDGEPCIGLVGNTFEDHERGKTLVFGDPEWSDYALELETKVVTARMPNPLTAWWGLGLRALDPYNMECFFFRPPASGSAGLAYVPIAHGLQPVWTESYRTQQFGPAVVPFGEWMQVRAEVRGREAQVWVGGQLVMSKTLTYYLWKGRPALYVGTVTDALFRRIRVEAIE
jgi:hypothetical protein